MLPSNFRKTTLLFACVAAAIATDQLSTSALAQAAVPAISIAASVPNELNPPGGAPKATFEQAAAFSWEEFIALNWPAGPQAGKPGQREHPADNCRFGDSKCDGPTVWQTYRGKVEIFPGPPNSHPTGYDQGLAAKDPSFGYDALPEYVYNVPVPACDSAQAKDSAPWINLDETDQITLDSMFAGTVADDAAPGNSSPQLIRFLAKANRVQYTYVAANQWFDGAPMAVRQATRAYLLDKKASPPPNSSNLVSLPNATIEIKAAWRPLNKSELASGRFHSQIVRSYERAPGSNDNAFCYRDARMGLIALHIIQKTPSAPYFIYATFEQSDNLLRADGSPVEDPEGRLLKPIPSTPTSPQVCLQDDRPAPGQPDKARVIVTDDPRKCLPAAKVAFCDAPGRRLFYRNANNNVGGPEPAPSAGNICVNKRDNDIPLYVVDANAAAHAAIGGYNKANKIASSPWLYYKLINVQFYPGDKVITTPTPDGSLFKSTPPYTATNPPASNFYQANIVVETNRSLQLFSGGLTLSGGGVSTDWDDGGAPHMNTFYGGKHYNSGGCLGCHGSQGQFPGKQIQAGDFSVILARGRVMEPEYPAVAMPSGMTAVPRNRTLIQ